MTNTTPSGALLEVNGVRKRFVRQRPLRQALLKPLEREHVQALNGVTFHIAKGELVGLLGANGAGKTTLLRILTTMVRADEGTVRIGGADVRENAAAVRDRVSTSLAAERALYWRLSARENLRLWAELYDLPRADVATRIEELLRIAGLSADGHRIVREYSSGMMQRLMIARALLSRPELLLLDEPTRSMDPLSARDFRGFLRNVLLKQYECGVLLATHDADEAFNVCDRVVVLERGRVVATGSAQQLAFDVLGSRHVLLAAQRSRDVLDTIAVRHGASVLVPGEPAGEWDRFVFRIPGGDSEASAFLSDAISSGVAIASFSREEASLAELIEGVSRRVEAGGRGEAQ
jgi:ABC-2 type transport system ATP-binding protein